MFTSKNDADQLQIILDVNQQSKLHWETQRGQANYSGKEFWLLTFESSSERGLQDETLSASKTFLVVVFTVEVTRWSVSCLLLRPCLHPSLAAGPPIITHQIDVSIRQTNTARSIPQHRVLTGDLTDLDLARYHCTVSPAIVPSFVSYFTLQYRSHNLSIKIPIF